MHLVLNFLGIKAFNFMQGERWYYGSNKISDKHPRSDWENGLTWGVTAADFQIGEVKVCNSDSFEENVVFSSEGLSEFCKHFHCILIFEFRSFLQ